jgi:hypothetical protein
METNMNSSVKVAKDVKIQLDRFDGTNYTRWMDKMIFLLTSLKIYTFLIRIYLHYLNHKKMNLPLLRLQE